MSELRGECWIGGRGELGRGPASCAVDPTTDESLEPVVHDADLEQVGRAAELAAGATLALRRSSREERALLLERIATGLEELGDELLARAAAETALPLARLQAERGRTCAQLRIFAGVVREGSHLDVRIDRADPARTPIPKPDLRRYRIALGPVAVFGASNFPLAFSVAGGDTAAALAAGCPVLVKAHPAHPGTSEHVGRVIAAAVAACGLPAGTFALLHGARAEVGAALVRDPRVRAVAFTGSLAGGRALFDLAASRPEPIPVFAEMGSVNPLVLLPGAIAARGAEIAEGLGASVVLGCGQFCTNPGLVFLLAGPATEDFLERLGRVLGEAPDGWMLHAGIARGYAEGLESLGEHPAVQRLTAPRAGTGECRATPALLRTEASALLEAPELYEENFGPSTLVVVANDREELRSALQALPGQLTAGIHAEAGELGEWSEVLEILADKAGRVIHGGYPTGVEVSPAMQHGGPYPATTDVRTTSVGTAAIERFLRPIAYQNFPVEHLPEELRG